jgi:tetratricopeptide (TPR) repeat protein
VKRALLVASAFLALAAPAAAGDARGAMDEGFALFAAQGYKEAALKFEEAAAKAGDEGLDPAVARYDRATALLRAGRFPEAAAAFEEALRSADPGLRAKSHYNQGIALAAAAEAAGSLGEPGKAVMLLDQALGAYESAMRIDPKDEDPKVNHELASRKKSQLEGKMREQERDRGTGMHRPEKESAEVQRPGPQVRKPGAPEKEMTPDEARTMLDAMKRQEQSQRSRIRLFSGRPAPVDKNW